MKKNFMKTALVAVFCLAVGYTAYNAQKGNQNLSSLVLDNVEALAGESGGSSCMSCRADYYCDCIITTGGVITSYCPYMRGF